MPHDFVPLAERVIDEILASDPAFASYVGDHRHDHQLADLSSTGVASTVAMLRDAADRLAEIDDAELTEPDRVDLTILQSVVDRRRFELVDIRSHEWNPLVYNPGAALYGLLSRDFAPADERLTALAGRLNAIPDVLATARANLHDCPLIHLQTAIGQFAGVADLIRGDVPQLVRSQPTLGGLVNPAIDRAAGALDDFVDWLRLAVAGGEGRSPRLGRPKWEAKLWYTLDTQMSAADVLSAAYALLENVTEQLRELAADVRGGPASDHTVREAFAALADEHPDDQSVVELARLTMTETTEFVRAHDLVSLSGDPCLVLEMPPYARGVAVAYCESPGPLELADVPTFYCIAPTPPDWPPDRVVSFYREYNNHMLRDLTVHEAMPGHYLQQAHGRRARGSTRSRAIGFSGTFIEGWACYAEQIMAEAGFGGREVRMQQLKMQLRMTINAILDQLVHCDDLSEADAMAMMTQRGFQEEGEAAGKWRRALLTATQLSTYFVGYTEVSAIGHARPAEVSRREWHDRMLSFGSPSPRHVRTLMGI